MLKEDFIRSVISEDIGRGDLFQRVSESISSSAYILAKSDGVLAGVEYLKPLSKMFDIEFKWNFKDGEKFLKGDKLLIINGDSKDILSLERSILNIILHATSIATLTNSYVEKLKSYKTKLLDTRKTRPLLREFEKYAVRCGGGINHRMGLDDALMLKDTHLETIENLELFMKEAREKIPFTSNIEIECETLDMAKKAMKCGADIIMCDNMGVNQIKEVVLFRNQNFPTVLIEASGNITIENIESIASTGVDAISTGALIHQSKWIDLSMKIESIKI